MKTSLYEVAAIYRAQLEQLADLDMPPEVVADTLEAMQGDIEAKLRAVIAYSLELDILATGAKDASKRMADRAKVLEGRVDTMRAYALTHMQGVGIGEVSTDEWAAKVAKKPASVQIDEGAILPLQFLRTKMTTEPDKTAIKAAIQAGEVIPGAEIVSGFRLAIK